MAPGSISIELKTLYGYESMLFGLIADSRRGIHGQVDIRKYFVPGGHRAMDKRLIYRTIHTIRQAMVLQHEFHSLWSSSNQTAPAIPSPVQRQLASSPQLPRGVAPIGRNKIPPNKQDASAVFHAAANHPRSIPPPQQPQQQAQVGRLQPGNRNPVAVNLPEPNLDDPSPPQIMSIVPQSIDFQEYAKYIHVIPETEWEGDFVYAPFPPSAEIDHILGPKIQGHKELCKQLIFYKMRNFLGLQDAYNFHCDICGTYVA
jgi:hypothetical protein